EKRVFLVILFTSFSGSLVSRIPGAVQHDVSIRFMDFVRDNPHQQIFEDELFTIRYFQKGSGHITFKRLDLVDKMNDIVAKHYPSALSAK
ncbi:DUF4942 domain-containing protein, partial [Escherichia coli]